MTFEFIAAILLYTIPGYLMLKDKFEEDERLALSPFASLIAYSVTALILHMIGLPIQYSIIVIPICLLLFWRNLKIKISKDLSIVAAVSIGLCLILSNLPLTPYHADGIFQMIAAESFTTEDWMSANFIDNYFEPVEFPQPITYRPPLNNLNMGYIMSLLGISYDSAKAYALTFTAALALMLYCIVKRIYDEKTAKISALTLAAANPYVIALALKADVYNIAAYICLCLLLLIKTKKSPVLLAVAASAAYLTHAMGTVFIISLILYHIIKDRRNLRAYVNERSLTLFLVFLLCVSPILIRNQLLFSKPTHSSSAYMPYLLDLEDYYRLEPPKPAKYINHMLDIKNLILIKGGALWKTFMPVPYSMAFQRFQPLALLDPIEWRYSMSGLLSIPLLIMCLLYLVKDWRKLIPAIFFISLVISALVFGIRVSYAISTMYPITLLLGAYGLYRIRCERRIVALVIMSMVLAHATIFPYMMSQDVDRELFTWFEKNSDEDDVIMSRQHHQLNYYTGRKTMPTPKEEYELILSTIEKYGVDFFAVHREDLRLRDINLKSLNQSLSFRYESEEFWVYKTVSLGWQPS
jgi:hypothetical protein